MIFGLATLLTFFLPKCFWPSATAVRPFNPHSLVFMPILLDGSLFIETTTRANIPVTPLTFRDTSQFVADHLSTLAGEHRFFLLFSISFFVFGWNPQFLSVKAQLFASPAPVVSPSVVVKAAAEPARCEGIDPSDLRCALI